MTASAPTISQPVYYALRTFRDYDGLTVAKGAKLGELVQCGTVTSRSGPKVTAWNTILDGSVTAVIAGAYNDKIGKINAH